ncbi:MAG: hypothetical protein ACLFP4_12945 [Spirochaetales bacterium]
MSQIRELFKAYMASELPTSGGLIVTTMFDDSIAYSRYEITSYDNVKDIYRNEDGLVFQADGYKQFVIVEPSSYNNKHVEPAMRDRGHTIPYRFKEVDTYVTKRQDRIMMGKEPVITYGSFTILEPVGSNFAYVAYKTDDLVDSMKQFLAESLWQDAGVPRADAEKAAKGIANTLPGILYPART